MNSVVISSGKSNVHDDDLVKESVGTFTLNGLDIGCCLLKTDEVNFDQKDSVNAQNVLLQKLGFSCNYRDRSLLLNFAVNARKHAQDDSDDMLYACIGSDFVARVIDKGNDVNHLNIGDVVIPNDSYPIVKESNAIPGIPTNEASSRIQILHKDKLIKIPANMSVSEAAAFTIGAQTAYSMLKKVKIDEDKNILVTSAKSSTSLFVINAIKNKENLYILTSSSESDAFFNQMGIKNIIHVDYKDKAFFKDMKEVQQMINATRGFEIVIDPFIDIHLKHLLNFVKLDAKYITCGLFHQVIPDENPISTNQLTMIYSNLIQKNISIEGNCLGDGEDIERALAEYADGIFKPIIDSVYSGNNVAAFFDRTYNSKEKIGKVVYLYEDQ